MNSQIERMQKVSRRRVAWEKAQQRISGNERRERRWLELGDYLNAMSD
jgi:hypothetical protein